MKYIGAEDWHQLCVRYPAKRRDGGLTVNWGSAARDWDGVHLSLGGLLSGEQARLRISSGMVAAGLLACGTDVLVPEFGVCFRTLAGP